MMWNLWGVGKSLDTRGKKIDMEEKKSVERVSQQRKLVKG